MITLFELAEYNAAKKNKTRRVNKTHKDIEAFLLIQGYFNYLKVTANPLFSYTTFWAIWDNNIHCWFNKL